MADIEKVIKGLDCCSFPCKESCHECQYYPDGTSGCAQLAKDALELLKKQVPIQPKKVLQAGVAREYYRCFCPECGTHVGNILNGERADIVSYFCQNCGQAVKWE